jgi:TolA-binding protein
VADKPAPAAPAVIEPTPAPPTKRPSEIEQRFKSGWALLRAGKAREAARELGAAADLAPHDPLAADARYFQAIAYVRAGERLEAERILVRFLDSAPKSLRRGRAAVLLGRLIGERGDTRSARAWLESAVDDPDPAIASAARAGLETLK